MAAGPLCYNEATNQRPSFCAVTNRLTCSQDAPAGLTPWQEIWPTDL